MGYTPQFFVEDKYFPLNDKLFVEKARVVPHVQNELYVW